VYGSGAEPDPRFSLANERTFLAWIRTTLALLAAAAAVDALDLPIPGAAQRFIAAVLAVTSLLCAVQAWRGWMRTERALRNRKPLPSSPANLPIVVGVGLVALTLLVVTLVR
jgi:putative membrane protein